MNPLSKILNEPRLREGAWIETQAGEGEEMTQGYHIAGEIRATTVNNLIVYRMFNGEKWIRLDDPDADRVWDLMGLEPEVRKVTREYYAELDRVAEGSTPSIPPETP